MHHGLARRQRGASKTRVVGDADGLDTLHQSRKPIKVPEVNTGQRAQAQPDAMKADGIALARLMQHAERGTAVGKEVLGVNFDEAQARRVLQNLFVVGLAQTDPHVGATGERQATGNAGHVARRSLVAPACGQ